MIKLCQETDLPLMREQYSFKLTFCLLYTSIDEEAKKYLNDKVENIEDAIPVSYTHLDVYKRQIYHNTIEMAYSYSVHCPW